MAAAGKDHLLSLHKFSTSSSLTSSSKLGVLVEDDRRGRMVVKDTWDSLPPPPTLTPLSRLAATAKKYHRGVHIVSKAALERRGRGHEWIIVDIDCKSNYSRNGEDIFLSWKQKL